MSLLNVGIAFDQLVNTFIGGKPDETLSARAWRCKDSSKVWKVAQVVLDTVFFFDKGHCEMSYMSEVLRKQLPSDYSTTKIPL